jgi:hypothetical protein
MRQEHHLVCGLVHPLVTRHSGAVAHALVDANEDRRFGGLRPSQRRAGLVGVQGMNAVVIRADGEERGGTVDARPRCGAASRRAGYGP